MESSNGFRQTVGMDRKVPTYLPTYGRPYVAGSGGVQYFRKLGRILRMFPLVPPNHKVARHSLEVPAPVLPYHSS